MGFGYRASAPMRESRLAMFLLVLPALVVVLALFVYPLSLSVISAFTTKTGEATLDNFAKTAELYRDDIIFTFVIVVVSTAFIGMTSAAIGGYLILGENPRAVAALKWLYRWPLFIPMKAVETTTITKVKMMSSR